LKNFKKNNRKKRNGPKKSSGEKGQIKEGKSVTYAIRNKKTKKESYIGVTNNPTRRKKEHQKNNKIKKSEELVVTSKPMTRKRAENFETYRMIQARKKYGRKPKNNKTWDGKYHRKKKCK